MQFRHWYTLRLKPSNHANVHKVAITVRSIYRRRDLSEPIHWITGIDSLFCKEGNEVSSKVGAQIILRGILGMPINLNGIPATRSMYDPEMDTIAEAFRVPSAENITIEDDV
jgi:hypothetical protein